MAQVNFTATTTRGCFRRDGNCFLLSPGAREIKYINGLFATLPWQKLVPDTAHQVVTAGYGTYDGGNENLTRATYCTTAWVPGSYALTYCPQATTLTVDLGVFSGLTRARWYDPVERNVCVDQWVAIS